MLKVASFLALSAMLVGCGTFVRSSTSEAAYDYSDWTSYDKPFATSPDYAAAALVRGDVAPAAGKVTEGEPAAEQVGGAPASK
jgi:hypothetical protein